MNYLIKTCEHRSIKQLQQHACRLYENINLVLSMNTHTRKLKSDILSAIRLFK